MFKIAATVLPISIHTAVESRSQSLTARHGRSRVSEASHPDDIIEHPLQISARLAIVGPELEHSDIPQYR
jgi:hypothetical protein